MTEKPPRPPLAFIRPFTTRFFNPISRRFVRWLPGFAVLGYRGRRSGRAYRTPMNVFRHGGDWVFALTYGSDVQWVKNVIAAGEATLEVRTRKIRLVDPKLIVDPERRLMPFGVRQFLGLMRVSEFLRMREATAPGGGGDQSWRRDQAPKQAIPAARNDSSERAIGIGQGA